MPKMTFVNADGTRKEVDAPLGLSVMEIAQKNDIEQIEGEPSMIYPDQTGERAVPLRRLPRSRPSSLSFLPPPATRRWK